MKSLIKIYTDKKQLAKDKEVIRLAEKYLEKAKNNLQTMKILSEINLNIKSRDLLSIPKDYDSDGWIVITGYYAMYTSALSLIAKAGFKSKNHAATLAVLEELFVKKRLLDTSTYLKLKNASFHKEELEKISNARHQREIAQYSITKQTTKDIAERIKKDAYDFVNKVEIILEQWQE